MYRGEHDSNSKWNPRKILQRDPYSRIWSRDCRCVGGDENVRLRSNGIPGEPLGIAAVEFCSQLFEDAAKNHPLPRDPMKWNRQKARQAASGIADELAGFENVSLCEHNLTDEAKLKEMLGNATARSFVRVCQEECQELVETIHNQTSYIAKLGSARMASYTDLCSLAVVKDVESHLFGCCAKTCGWNKKVCALAASVLLASIRSCLLACLPALPVDPLVQRLPHVATSLPVLCAGRSASWHLRVACS